jgi:2-oxo-3-hexenedioate decarboxylase
MSSFDTNVLAQEIWTAYNDGGVIASPSSRFEDFDLNAAYAAEAEFKKLHAKPSTGLKVGYANKAVWRALKMETLVWAHMYEDTVHFSRDELALPYYRSPKIEPEIVFKLKTQVDAEMPLASVDWLAIGFEIIDSPFPDWQFKPADFVAAFGLHLGLVIGPPLHVTSENVNELAGQLAQFKLKLSKNGEMVEEGAGKNSLRSPALCLAELNAALYRQEGATPLAAGDLISTGTLTNGQLVQKGEQWRVDLEGIPLAPLSLRFA